MEKIFNYWFDRGIRRSYKSEIKINKSEIKKFNGGKQLFYEKNYARIGINTNYNLPLSKQLKFPTLAIMIRCVLQKGEKLYPKIYLDECLYEL